MKLEVMSYYIDRENEKGLVKVTKNGEVCYDYDQCQFVVFDETYAYEVGRTPYPACAVVMLEAYAEHYLDK